MEYNLARLDLERGKKIRREIWADDKFVQLVDGNFHMGNEIWECGNADATAKDWEVLSKDDEKSAQKAQAKAQKEKDEAVEKHQKETAKAAEKEDGKTPEAENVQAAQLADLPPTPEQINPPVDKEGKIKESKNKLKTGPPSERDDTPTGDGPVLEKK